MWPGKAGVSTSPLDWAAAAAVSVKQSGRRGFLAFQTFNKFRPWNDHRIRLLYSKRETTWGTVSFPTGAGYHRNRIAFTDWEKCLQWIPKGRDGQDVIRDCGNFGQPLQWQKHAENLKRKNIDGDKWDPIAKIDFQSQRSWNTAIRKCTDGFYMATNQQDANLVELAYLSLSYNNNAVREEWCVA